MLRICDFGGVYLNLVFTRMQPKSYLFVTLAEFI